MIYVPLSRVEDSPFQPRRHYDAEAVAELADSIERDGQLQTPVGRLVTADGRGVSEDRSTEELVAVLDGVDEPEAVQLAYGHRRARAWRLVWERHEARAGDQVAGAGLPGLDGVPVGTMPVRLQPLTDEQMFARGVTENRQREGVSAVEEAEAMRQAEATFGWSHEEIGRRFGYSRSAVSNKLRLLRLPDDVRQLNVTGELSEAKARALVALADAHTEHEGVVGGLVAEGVVFDFATVSRYAVEVESASSVRARVETELEQIQAEVERQRLRREPEMFAGQALAQDEPFTSEAGADAEQAPAFTPESEADTAEPLAATEGLDADHADAASAVTAEIDRIHAAYVAADQWRHAGSAKEQPHTVAIEKLETTVEALRTVVRDVAVLNHRLLPLDVENPLCQRALTLGRRVHSELQSYERHLSARQDDGYDDGGRQLAAVAEAQGLEPFDQADGVGDGDEDLDALAEQLAADEDPAPADLWFWPPVKLPDVWESIDGMTVAQLDEAYRLYALPLFTRYEGYYQTGQLKPNKQGLVRRVVRHHADLAAVQRLTDEHMAEFATWFDGLFEGSSTYDTVSNTSRGHRRARHEVYREHGKEWSNNIKTAGQIADTADMVARLGLMTEGEQASVKREIYRLAASFCYSLFLETRAADVSTVTPAAGDGQAGDVPSPTETAPEVAEA